MNASNLVNAYANEITALCQGIERAKALRERFAHLGLDKPDVLTEEDCSGIGIDPKVLLATMAALDGFDAQMTAADETGRTGYGLLYLLYQGR